MHVHYPSHHTKNKNKIWSQEDLGWGWRVLHSLCSSVLIFSFSWRFQRCYISRIFFRNNKIPLRAEWHRALVLWGSKEIKTGACWDVEAQNLWTHRRRNSKLETQTFSVSTRNTHAKASGRQWGYWNGDVVITDVLKCILHQLSTHFKQMWLSHNRVTHKSPCSLRSQLTWLMRDWAWDPRVSEGFLYAFGKIALTPQEPTYHPWWFTVVIMKYEAAWLHGQQGPSQTRAISQSSVSHHSFRDSAKEI